MNLQGKVAVVTGGAMGNGKGIVESLLKYGASVVILDKSTELTNTVNELGTKGYKVLGINVDISNKNAMYITYCIKYWQKKVTVSSFMWY